MKWWQVMTLDGVRSSIFPAASILLSLERRPSLRRPHHEIHFNAIAEAEYHHPRFGPRDASDTDEPISTISSSSPRG